MKRTLILTLAVLLGALALCVASLRYVNRSVDEAERLQNLAVLAVQEGRADEAKALMVALAGFWDDRAFLMETVACHDALHDVGAAIAEARICLECEDHDDFLRTMSSVDMGLRHLRDEEAVSLSNLY